MQLKPFETAAMVLALPLHTALRWFLCLLFFLSFCPLFLFFLVSPVYFLYPLYLCVCVFFPSSFLFCVCPLFFSFCVCPLLLFVCVCVYVCVSSVFLCVCPLFLFFVWRAGSAVPVENDLKMQSQGRPTLQACYPQRAGRRPPG